MVERSRRNWLAKLHLNLYVEPRAAGQSIAELSETRALSYLDGAHRDLVRNLARLQSDWAHLGLAQLCDLLEGTSGEHLVQDPSPSPRSPSPTPAPPAPIPLIMVTPPEDAVALPSNPATYLLRRFAGGAERAELGAELAAERERVWLYQLMDLLRLPTPPTFPPTSPPADARTRRPLPGPMPASLEEKLEREGIDWQHTAALELVDLILALELVK